MKIDFGLCVFCGQCAEVSGDGAVRETREFELATTNRSDLVTIAEYALNPDGSHERFIGVSKPNEVLAGAS